MAQPNYSLQIDPEGLARVRLDWPGGRPLVELLLLSSLHPVGALDEVLEARPVQVEALEANLVEVSQVARSTCWPWKRAVLRSYPDRLEYWVEIEGSGAIERLDLFEAGPRADEYIGRPAPTGYRRPARARTGWLGSRAFCSTVFSPAPNTAFQQYGWPGESFTNHPSNDPGRGGDWFFTPAPFAYGLGDEGRWLTLGLGCRAEEATFSRFDFNGGPVWGLSLSYEGYTRVQGRWRSPTVVLLPGADEYLGLASYTAWLRGLGQLPEPPGAERDWWRGPIWCGWGEQVARSNGQPAWSLCTESNYQAWLAQLEARGVKPDTIVIDDRWMASPGSPRPDPARWPHLADFIEARHRAGQRVLLWHNAWERQTEASNAALTRREDGSPASGPQGGLLLDPTSAPAEDHLRECLRALLESPPRGLGADGLKVDYTHATPSGPGYVTAASSWGNALLHRLLSLTCRLAKEARPDALVECQAANPLFRGVADMLRLNDLHTDLRSVVAPMTHRARVARAAGFDLIDTDGWPVPSRAALLEYLAVQPTLGVPSLYYTNLVDQTGEALEADDYRQIAEIWRAYRRA